jgi:hypothetical protein
MRRNLSQFDRAVRGTVAFFLALALPWPWAVLAVIPLATAVMGFCPLYVPLHIDTLHHHRPRHR